MSIELSELSASARAVADGLGLAADASLAWDQFVQLGWLMLEIPEQDGGLGLGLPAACALHEELGRSLVAAPFLAASLSVDAVCQSACAQRDALLESVGSGERYVAVSLAITALTLAEANGADRLTGCVSAVPDADRASHVLVWTAAGDRLALVATDAGGVRLEERQTWDKTRRLYDVHLDDVELDAALVLASGAGAAGLVERVLLRRDFALAAEAVGGAAAILERTVAYLGDRQQFGRPLAMFQALKHRCADLRAQVEAASALLHDGLAKFSEASGAFAYGPDAALAAQSAKLLAATVYAAVVEEALQLHGGIGMTAEHECHLFLKRAMLDEHLGRGRDAYARVLASAHLGEMN